jgi:hypothetical protein
MNVCPGIALPVSTPAAPRSCKVTNLVQNNNSLIIAGNGATLTSATTGSLLAASAAVKSGGAGYLGLQSLKLDLTSATGAPVELDVNGYHTVFMDQVEDGNSGPTGYYYIEAKTSPAESVTIFGGGTNAGLFDLSGGVASLSGSVRLGSLPVAAPLAGFFCYQFAGSYSICNAYSSALNITTTDPLAIVAPLNITVPQATVQGSTSGYAIFSEPFQGAALKRVLISLTMLDGTASYTFPTPFARTPDYFVGATVAGTTVSALSTTGVTITGTGLPSSGVITLEGY